MNKMNNKFSLETIANNYRCFVQKLRIIVQGYIFEHIYKNEL